MTNLRFSTPLAKRDFKNDPVLAPADVGMYGDNERKDAQNSIQFQGGNGIRGLACLIVIGVHSFQINYPELSPYTAGCGKIGVWLFFVLSSFLLTYHLELNGFSWQSLLTYGMGRFFRIIPLFLVSVLVYFFFGDLGDLEHLKEVILFEKGYGHFWTIPVEFKFYFLLPFMVYFFSQLRNFLGIMGMHIGVLVLMILHQYFWPSHMIPENSIDMVWYIPCFMLGCAGAMSLERIRPHINSRIAPSVGSVILILIVLSTPAVRHLLWGTPLENIKLMSDFVFLSIGWIFFIFTQIDGKGFLGKWLSKGIIPNIGKWSYSVYLFHILIYQKLALYFSSGIFMMIISIVAALLVGVISYKYIELPISTFRHRIQKICFG